MTLLAAAGGTYAEATGLLVSRAGAWVPVASLFASQAGAWIEVPMVEAAPPTHLSQLEDTFASGAPASFWLPPETTGSALPPVVDGAAVFGTAPPPEGENLLSPPLLVDSLTVEMSLEWSSTESYAPLDGVQVYFAGSWLWWAPYVDPSTWFSIDLATPLAPAGKYQQIRFRFTRVVQDPPQDSLEYSIDGGATWLPSLSPLPPPEPTEAPPGNGAISISSTKGDAVFSGPFTGKCYWVNKPG